MPMIGTYRRKNIKITKIRYFIFIDFPTIRLKRCFDKNDLNQLRMLYGEKKMKNAWLLISEAF